MGRSNEHIVQNQIRLALSTGPVRLFRNNTGALKDQNGRLVRFGLCTGSSDLIGWTTIEITEEHLGQKIAVFTAIEVKDRGTPTDAQMRFLERVQSSGGLAGVARCVASATRIIERLQRIVK